jgi:photosystem II stability/assembly factor-like uncharacterized protein
MNTVTRLAILLSTIFFLGQRPIDSVHMVWPKFWFWSEQEGVRVGSRGLMITADGGESWQVRSKRAFVDACFLQNETWWLLEWSYAGAHVLRTADGGRTFENLTPQDMLRPVGGGIFCQIEFPNSRTGAVMGIDDYEVDIFRIGETKSFVAVTRDAGRTWSRIDFPEDSLFVSFDWLDERTILVAGQFLWRSDDCGATWKKVTVLPHGVTRLTIDSSWASRLWCLAPPNLFRSDDTGSTWKKVHVPAGFSAENGVFLGGGTTWVSGFLSATESALLGTLDGGETWTVAFSEPGHKRLQPFFLTPLRGWLLASEFVWPKDKPVELWSTRDGGAK